MDYSFGSQPPHKAFLTFSPEMAEAYQYLNRVAHVEAFGRSIKVDDVATALAKKTKRTSSWTTRQLSSKEFMVSCPDSVILQSLMSGERICGDGFFLLVNRWNKFRGGVPHKLKYIIYATLRDLPLYCWTVDAVATIISGFGTPCRASRTSLHCLGLMSSSSGRKLRIFPRRSR